MLTGYNNRQSWRSRTSAALLSLGIMGLILLALLQLGAMSQKNSGPGGNLTAIQLSASPEAARQKAQKRAAAKPKQAVITLPQIVPTSLPTPPPFKIIKLSRKEFAALDISGLTRQPAKGAGNSDAGQGSGAVYGPGAGPGGARLFNAE